MVEKPETERVEETTTVDDKDEANSKGQPLMRSELDNLSIWESLRRYKVVTTIAMVAAFKINLNGGLVSNKGFIRQMTDPETSIIEGNRSIRTQGRSLYHLPRLCDRLKLTGWSWFVIGQLFASVALDRLNASDPYNFRTPIYTQGIMTATIATERSIAARDKQQGRWAVFQGRNLLRFIIAGWPKITQQFVGLSVFNSNVTYFYLLRLSRYLFDNRFAATGSISVVIAWFILPEVTRRTPAEIDELFEKKVKLRKFDKYVTDVQINAAGQEKGDGTA
ncbi:predicted protein [Aspergillus nidulans FGSC A4]|uniref:Major facilitator superfamily (MFS) profile domain-containing protein n=1 Tax=Emericella nidulans (strain FGSC A4 / ATCC 38163 / CBS 112.46 / NRRL 194 / M139) TaxID=227321 RepID=Q5AXQ4_EMENI|nr:hypothetical protein [Aspergillus nidulans FGSC A4]EAA57681.1 predicted protein [Aspergillus nidulans FGSC A4]CBF71756.1 TPA: conserved hypothetical protein [Aspergillus nidulans FGSC A4]|eukprot:XP_664530.1 predicted protein [Aspergillus nidulans FGSC A4]